MNKLLFLSIIAISIFSCKENDTKSKEKITQNKIVETASYKASRDIDKLLAKYTTFRLTTDISKYTDKEKILLKHLINAAKVMDGMFWVEAYGNKTRFLNKISDSKLKKFAIINYGPWDRLGGNESFIKGIAKKPLGANFYPKDMTKEEFEAADIKDKESLYTFIKRDENGKLFSVPYYKAFKKEVWYVADMLLTASHYAKDAGFINYLRLRAEALKHDNYQLSDMAWLDMKDNKFDIVIGPIENYEDALFGYKAAHEAYVLIKDMDWSKRLKKFAKFLPELQRGLPVDDKYKQEKPGSDVELNAYDVVYYAGDCNAGSKTIAINLPNDEEVQLQKGTRRLQLKNAMKAKFDKILMPIADELIDPDQKKRINFNAFFSNTMFHEVAHGLGIKNTLDGKGTVRKALKELYSALEEGKADMLGLYMIRQLHKKGQIEGDLKDFYTTFMTSIFRSIRFGASSAHGRANLIRFNFFKELGAFAKNKTTNKYKIDYKNFEKAMDLLSTKILTLQGDGDYNKVKQFVEKYGKMGKTLQSDINSLSAKGIPVDVIFEQGIDVLGL